MLCSELLNQHFGGFVLKVLKDDGVFRLAELSANSDLKIVALTRFNNLYNSQICFVRDLIRMGEPIGESVKRHFDNVYKINIGYRKVVISKSMAERFKQGKTICNACVYNLCFKQDGEVVEFCKILEIYSNDFFELVKKGNHECESSNKQAFVEDERVLSELRALQIYFIEDYS
jgi:hypothetical protein